MKQYQFFAAGLTLGLTVASLLLKLQRIRRDIGDLQGEIWRGRDELDEEIERLKMKVHNLENPNKQIVEGKSNLQLKIGEQG